MQLRHGAGAMLFLTALSAVGASIAAPAAHAVCGDHFVDDGEECDDGNQVGGDGCARNCTIETRKELVLDADRSFAVTQLTSLAITINITGSVTLTTDRKSTRLNSSHGYISYA